MVNSTSGWKSKTAGRKISFSDSSLAKSPKLFSLYFQKSPFHLDSLLTSFNITVTDSPCVCTTQADIIFSIFYYSY